MLRIDHIAKRYREQQVLRGIDLNVEAGEFVSLLGPSGCGKTTLLRIVCGIDMPDEGRVLFQGDDITRWPAARRGFGVVFQSYALFPNLTAAQNVAFGLNGQPAAQARERVAEMLSLVGLGAQARSEEHTSELQSPCNLVCRLLLEKKKMELWRTAPAVTPHSGAPHLAAQGRAD